MRESLFLVMSERENNLGEFAPEARVEETRTRAAVRLTDMLVFELEGDRWAIEARRVDSVVAWRPPAPIPEAGTQLAGVVQDAGRIIAVLNNPLGRPPRDRAHSPNRIVVCNTERGLIGLPATSTFGIEALEARGGAGSTLESPQGPAIILDPNDIARALVGRARIGA